VSARVAADGTIEEARLVLGAVASQPIVASKASEFLVGKKLSDEVIAEAGTLAASRAKPMDNTDLDVYWRKKVVPSYVGYALREIRGDDMSAMRLRTARQVL
jgi:CO/xanthine dehydrogenase FAD-binding subunit